MRMDSPDMVLQTKEENVSKELKKEEAPKKSLA